MSLYDKLNEINIMDELENKHFVNTLNEMAETKAEVARFIKSKTSIINEHILKCLLIQDTTNNLNHWCKEIRAFLPNVPILKTTKKYPDEKMIRECTIGYFGDSLLNIIDSLVNSINYEENTNITNYNKQALYDCIIKYYEWLAIILSKNGNVKLQEVNEEINLLVQEYKSYFRRYFNK